LEEASELFENYHNNLIDKLNDTLQKEEDIELIVYIINSLFFIGMCLKNSDNNLINKWRLTINSILYKIKVIIDNNEEEQLIKVLYGVMDSIDPDHNINSTKIYKNNEIKDILELGI